MAGESESSRLDRELIEFLNESRVILPGIQVLFAFLLTVPFSSRFPKLSDHGRVLYTTCFITAAIAAVMLIAPTVFHRVRWRDRDKEVLLRFSNRVAIASSLFLAASMISAALLVTEFVHGIAMGVVMSVIVGLLIAVFWYLIPIVRKVRD